MQKLLAQPDNFTVRGLVRSEEVRRGLVDVLGQQSQERKHIRQCAR